MLLMREIIRRADSLPVSDAAVDSAFEHVREQFPPLTPAEVESLAKIARTKDVAFDSPESAYYLTRLANAHLLLSYRNGRVWYDVHPLVRENVLQRAAAVADGPVLPVPEPEPAPASPKLPSRATP